MCKKERETCEFEMYFKKSLLFSAVLSNDEIISSRPGLKTGVKNDIFWSEIGSGFGEPGGTPPPRIPRSTPGYHAGNTSSLCYTYEHSDNFKIEVPG